MNCTDFVLKSFSPFNCRQLLDVHLNTVAPNRDSLPGLPFLLGRSGQRFFLQNLEDCSTVRPGKGCLQFLSDSNRPVRWVFPSILNHSVTIISGDYASVRERSGAFVQWAFPFDPPLNGGRVDPKTLSQFPDTDFVLRVQLFDLLPLFECQCCLAMESHNFPLLCRSILSYVNVSCQYN